MFGWYWMFMNEGGLQVDQSSQANAAPTIKDPG